MNSDFDILGILGIWEKMCSVGFSLVFEFLFCWGILLSRVSFLFGQHKTKKPTIIIIWGLVDRWGGIWDFQHCIVITRGQEERIPKTASVVGTNFALGRFPFDFVCFSIFFVIFIDFNRFLQILLDFDKFWVVILIFLGFWGFGRKCAVLAFHLSLSFYFAGEFC